MIRIQTAGRAPPRTLRIRLEANWNRTDVVRLCGKSVAGITGKGGGPITLDLTREQMRRATGIIRKCGAVPPILHAYPPPPVIPPLSFKALRCPAQPVDLRASCAFSKNPLISLPHGLQKGAHQHFKGINGFLRSLPGGAVMAPVIIVKDHHSARPQQRPRLHGI